MKIKEENKKTKKMMAFAILITVLLLMCSCSNKESTGENKPFENTAAANEIKKQSKEIEETHPVEYGKKIIKINGRENHVFIMKIDISDESVSVLPYLSFGKIYGFETLSDMAKKTKAYAAVTGGFFFQYGVPSGLVANNGEIISPGKGRFKSLIIEDGKARFETVETRIYININGTLIEMDRFNEPAEEENIALYSDAYGVTDRLKHMRDVFYIENGIVVKHEKTAGKANIPKNGFAVSFPVVSDMMKDCVGNSVEIIFKPEFVQGTMAYECASMLVEDGKSKAGDTMPWIGNLNHYDPRTCMGIMSDGRIGFVVIDGRQQGYSSGTTGRETADLLISMGFTDAVMLDGGASAEMIIGGEIVNKPSFRGEERLLAGGFMIIVD